MAVKVDCVRLYVDDLEAGLAFYRDQLGHVLVWRTDDAAGLGLRDGVTEIVLHTTPRPVEVDLTVDEADEAAARFEAAGGRVVVPPFEIQIGRAVAVQDPWGNELVLLETGGEGRVIGYFPPQPEDETGDGS